MIPFGIFWGDRIQVVLWGKKSERNSLSFGSQSGEWWVRHPWWWFLRFFGGRFGNLKRKLKCFWHNLGGQTPPNMLVILYFSSSFFGIFCSLKRKESDSQSGEWWVRLPRWWCIQIRCRSHPYICLANHTISQRLKPSDHITTFPVCLHTMFWPSFGVKKSYSSKG